VIGRTPSRSRRPGARLAVRSAVALLVLTITSAWGSASSFGAHSARGAQPTCARRAGVPRRECPKLRGAPRLVSLTAGTPLAPVLVGNSYAVDAGRWSAFRPLRLSIEWLDGRGRRLARTVSLALTPAMAGARIAARICAVTSAASSCVALRLPGAVRTVAAYLQASCGSRRPAPPPYDPGFVLLSAPQIAHGWNPCRVDVWAIDTYGQPPLVDPGASWDALISQALAQASAATGVVFERSLDFAAAPGTPAAKPPGLTLPIGFGPLPPGVAGVGGPAIGASAFASAASVVLDSQRSWRAREALTVLLHEIGHALGLGHPVAPPAPAPETEVMDSRVSPYTAYQPGDLCGLFEVTWQQPCAGAAVLTAGQGEQGPPSGPSG
jgi:hypothetical protein